MADVANDLERIQNEGDEVQKTNVSTASDVVIFKTIKWHLKNALREMWNRRIILCFVLALSLLGVWVNIHNPAKSTPKLLTDATTEIDILKEKAKQGDSDAQSTLAARYVNGDGVPQDFNNAFDWYKKSATKVGAKDYTKAETKAYELFQKAVQRRAEQGDSKAQYTLGSLYNVGVVVPKDKSKAFEWLDKAAAQGDAEAEYHLGRMYSTGTGVSEDKTVAAVWFGKAAAQWQSAASSGEASAQRYLGQMYAMGDGFPKDAVKAAEWWQKAAAQGDEYAQLSLIECYSLGEGLPEDETKAAEWREKIKLAQLQESLIDDFVNSTSFFYWYVDWLRDVAPRYTDSLLKRAEQGDAHAQYKLGTLYGRGSMLYFGTDLIPMDNVKAVNWLKKSAEQGSSDAQYSLGNRYYDGEGVGKDAAKAAEWYEKVAIQGHRDAQNKLGDMYYDGKGVGKDAAKAAEWYEKAAIQGHRDAQNKLGDMYFYGEGVAKVVTKAVAWWQKASKVYSNAETKIMAAQGDAKAQYRLGAMYSYGIVFPKNMLRAIEWFKKAAFLGDVDAQLKLGDMYYEGKDVVEDKSVAAVWYKRAAAQGNDWAQYRLGLMYVLGYGVPVDDVLAYAWVSLAAASGNQNGAAKVRGNIENGMTAAERTEAQRLSSNWKKGQILVREGDEARSSELPSAASGIPGKTGSGTLFLINAAGQAITNHHVVDECGELRVVGRKGKATVVVEDVVNDLALVQVPGMAKTSEASTFIDEIKFKLQDLLGIPNLSDTSAAITSEPFKLRQGEVIAVFGFPLDTVLSSGGNLTPGVVSALTGLGNNSNQIQITAPVQPGSSGSPVLNKNGAVVGVVSMKLSDSAMAKATGQIGQTVNFAINGQTLRTFLDTHKVPYSTAGGLFSWDKSSADLADEARKWTLVVECWK